MARRKKTRRSGDWLFPNVTAVDEADDQSSLLDVLDNVLNRGAVLSGDVVLGVANVDLVYVKLSVLLAAMDKVMRNDAAFTPVGAGARRRSPRPAPRPVSQPRRPKGTKTKR